MPRKEIDYNGTVIYKIVCNDSAVTDCYVGHTTDFTRRKYEHKSDSKHSLYKLYSTIREKGGWDNWSMVEIEKYACGDSNEAKARERFHCEQLKANLNTNKPHRTKEEFDEYVKKYRETHKEENKKWREDNKDRLKEYAKIYYAKRKAMKTEDSPANLAQQEE